MVGAKPQYALAACIPTIFWKPSPCALCTTMPSITPKPTTKNQHGNDACAVSRRAPSLQFAQLNHQDAPDSGGRLCLVHGHVIPQTTRPLNNRESPSKPGHAAPCPQHLSCTYETTSAPDTRFPRAQMNFSRTRFRILYAALCLLSSHSICRRSVLQSALDHGLVTIVW